MTKKINILLLFLLMVFVAQAVFADYDPDATVTEEGLKIYKHSYPYLENLPQDITYRELTSLVQQGKPAYYKAQNDYAKNNPSEPTMIEKALDTTGKYYEPDVPVSDMGYVKILMNLNGVSSVPRDSLRSYKEFNEYINNPSKETDFSDKVYTYDDVLLMDSAQASPVVQTFKSFAPFGSAYEAGYAYLNKDSISTDIYEKYVPSTTEVVVYSAIDLMGLGGAKALVKGGKIIKPFVTIGGDVFEVGMKGNKVVLKTFQYASKASKSVGESAEIILKNKKVIDGAVITQEVAFNALGDLYPSAAAIIGTSELTEHLKIMHDEGFSSEDISKEKQRIETMNEQLDEGNILYSTTSSVDQLFSELYQTEPIVPEYSLMLPPVSNYETLFAKDEEDGNIGYMLQSNIPMYSGKPEGEVLSSLNNLKAAETFNSNANINYGGEQVSGTVVEMRTAQGTMSAYIVGGDGKYYPASNDEGVYSIVSSEPRSYDELNEVHVTGKSAETMKVNKEPVAAIDLEKFKKTLEESLAPIIEADPIDLDSSIPKKTVKVESETKDASKIMGGITSTEKVAGCI